MYHKPRNYPIKLAAFKLIMLEVFRLKGIDFDGAISGCCEISFGIKVDSKSN